MASTDINRVVLTGNLTTDPDLRTLPGGSTVCKLRIGCNSRRKNQSTGEWADKPNYFNLNVWGPQGESCARFLHKGRAVAVDGHLDWREWEPEGGGHREAVDVVVDSIKFLGSGANGAAPANGELGAADLPGSDAALAAGDEDIPF